jgi:hypothetical protein
MLQPTTDPLLGDDVGRCFFRSSCLLRTSARSRAALQLEVLALRDNN